MGTADSISRRLANGEFAVAAALRARDAAATGPVAVAGSISSFGSYFPGLPLGVYAEAGERKAPSWVFDDDLSPSRYLEEALGWADAGVQLIGGCCGTGPDYIRALAEGLPGRVAGAGKEASAR